MPFTSRDLDILEFGKGSSKNYTKVTVTFDYNALLVLFNLQTVLYYMVCPIIGIIGITGNVIGLIILVKSGLNRRCNILLFFLTVFEIMSLIDIVNISFIISDFSRIWIGSYVELIISLLFYVIPYFLTLLGWRVAPSITILIIIERILAIFLPFRFSSVVTSFKVTLTGISIVCVWFILQIYYFVSETDFFIVSKLNVTYGVIQKFRTNEVLTKFVAYYMNIAPFLLVTLGCIVISVKIVITQSRRRRLTSVTQKRRSSMQTTKTLLPICIMFSISQVIYTLNECVTEFLFNNTLFPTILLTMEYVTNLIFSLRSMLNSFLFIAINKNYRKIFLKLFSIR